MEYSIRPIPTWALCYLINSDPGELDNEDIETVDKWCKENGISVLSTTSDQEGESSESYFTHNPAFGLPTDVVDCNVIIY